MSARKSPSMATISVRAASPRIPIPPRKLQTGLNRFSAAVAEECSRQPGQRGQSLSHFALQRMEKEVGAMNHLARLLRDRGCQSIVPMAKRAYTDARQQVEVLAPVLIEHAHTFAAHQHDGRAAVGLDDVLRFEVSDGYARAKPPSRWDPMPRAASRPSG